MRLLEILALLVLGIGLTACGGGGGTLGTRPQQKTTLTGAVTEVDGTTSALGGIQLVLAETGERVTTSSDGAFAFDGPVPAAFTLALGSTPGPQKGGADDPGGDDGTADQGPGDEPGDDGGADEPGDDDGAEEPGDDRGSDDDDDVDDGDDATETEVEMRRVREGERLHVRIRLREGRIEQCEVSRSDHDEREVEIFLSRTDANDDADMKGKLELEARDDRERVEVEVEHATPDRELELVVIDLEGVEESQGVLNVDALGEAEWRFDSRLASSLPHGAATVADLEGFRFEVRDALDGTALLVGEAPELPPSAPADDDPGDDGDDDGAAERMRGRARLVADVAALEGYVEVRERADEGRQRFEIEAEHLAVGRNVEFFLEDPANAGSFLSIGVRTANVEGEAELELDTGDGAMLPGGVAEVSELQGLRVQVRDADSGDLLLHGTVPALITD